MPDTAGDYVVRYHMAGGYRVIGSAPVKVTDVGATLSGPERVDAGAEVQIGWTGPGHAADFVSIDAVGSGDAKYGPIANPYYDPACDLNDDGYVDVADLLILAKWWGTM